VLANYQITGSNHNCSNCGYNDDGICTYFETEQSDNKEIPSNVFSIGCKHWSNKKTATITKRIIKLFGGKYVR